MATQAEIRPEGPTIVLRTVDESAGRLCRNRDFEWYASLNMLYIAFAVWATPDTIKVGAFRYLLQTGIDVHWLWLVYLFVGGARVVALILNGTIPVYGPHLRAAGCILGAIIWSYMFIALIRLTDDTGTLSIGIGAWGLACIFELKALHKAVNDVGIVGPG